MARRFRTSTVMGSRCCPLEDLLILCGCSCKVQHAPGRMICNSRFLFHESIAFDGNLNTLTTEKMSKGRNLCHELARGDSLQLKN